MTSIKGGAFAGCASLETIEVGEANAAYLSDSGILFNKDKTEIIIVPLGIKGDITISDGVTSIGDYEFYNRSSLTSVTIPDSVTSIGDWAFSECSSLTSITIPDSVTSIGYDAFNQCFNLTNVNYLGTIDKWAEISFKHWQSNPLFYAHKLCIDNELVTEINITTATKITDYAFCKYEGLTGVTISDGVTSISKRTFAGCMSLERIEVSETNSAYISDGGILYNKDKTKIIIVPLSIKGDITISDGVTTCLLYTSPSPRDS